MYENNFSYFIVSSLPELKRIDLVNYKDNQNMVQDFKVLDSCILVQTKKKTLVFNSSSLLLTRSFDCLETKLFTRAHNGF
jgi:hypothetical protein